MNQDLVVIDYCKKYSPHDSR